MRIRDLPDWPPEPAGPFRGSYRSPSSEQAVLKQIVRLQDKSVTFTATFEGNQFTYACEAASSKLARNVAEILGKNIGKTVMQLGELEVES